MLILHALAELFFPPVCIVCQEDASTGLLCTRCISSLPHTGFSNFRQNPVENIFYGRLPLRTAFSEFYFEKSHIVQALLHQLKYRGKKEAGIFLGECMGRSISSMACYNQQDVLIPLPLHPKKEHMRGYNQANILCEGISAVTGQQIINGAIVRTNLSESQTRKHRMERWKNVEGIFSTRNPKAIQNQNIILVDDVVTTGATLEACGRTILGYAGSLSIATAAHATK